MLKPLEIEIPLEPVPLARPRVVFRQGKVHSYKKRLRKPRILMLGMNQAY